MEESSAPPAPEAPSRASRHTTTGSRAGRNLPAAVAVGVGLGAVLLVSLLTSPVAFVIVVNVAVLLGTWEVRTALMRRGHTVPLVPSLIGASVMLWSAWLAGPEVLTVATVLTCVTVLLWRAADGVNHAAGDTAAGMLTALYPGFLASFAVLMLGLDEGVQRVITFLLVASFSDIGGYAVGVLFGRHPMAPTLSPKKSWEGLAGSVLLATAGAIGCVVGLLGGQWWEGVLLGVLVAVCATVGDLLESSLKRDLGIKDMSHLLPGHGGFMDRLDSLLVCAPVVWVVVRYIVPG